MKKIRIIKSYDIGEIENMIDSYLESGYELKDDLKIVYDHDFKDMLYCQVITKEYEE